MPLKGVRLEVIIVGTLEKKIDSFIKIVVWLYSKIFFLRDTQTSPQTVHKV